jgi:hypothetical protein
MPALLLVAAFLLAAAGSEPAGPPTPPDSSPDPVLPFPLQHARPEVNWSLAGGSRQGVGVSHPDGSVTDFCWADRTGPAGLTHRHLLHEEECYRRFLVTGSRIGVEDEWYLGHGFSAGLDLGVTTNPLGGPPLLARGRLTVDVIESLGFVIGYNPAWGWDAGWIQHFTQ